MHPSEHEPQAQDVRKLLVDLYNLLEDYAPPWYSQELHKRLLAAVKALGNEIGTGSDS